ncbi:16S rRNA (guanine(966)-N(2))-methyltransferase RsmD [Gordonia polyisoprenivorans]|uniref:16S rRNA (guanine(966)-N(2))-methyltransferase RsmD n=1 Tax=Gordonia polyisoprenivorans TaxID=84595 RepID=UPI000B99E6FC|nr:16S rRNA (guanine(966)-N(2))-methyltransferase RsmD [Gordonia polyisoprenivorans]OZC30150.1 16S rRNA (guanine(966)-N(2))-methyltransferase RsmD [Gordonia polyisoprenivorans]
MTRIIAGRHGGRPLKVPDAGTRPTSDRVREAVFNILDARIDLEGAAILDLYAGSGALGLEALSRGASSAVFVDNRRRATAVVTANLRALGVAEVGRVITAPVSAFLAAGAPSRVDVPHHEDVTGRFDVIFSDPPYALTDDEVHGDLAALGAGGWLADGGLLVLERGRRATTRWPVGWEVVTDKSYGDTTVQVARVTGGEAG